ncbi:MAG: TadE/TadG family type IV pilus assembly protein [Paracoccaceae bacterium]|nr:TadE/TadG family type IV pilus assembly protein [Paracoccaceae bacterium]
MFSSIAERARARIGSFRRSEAGNATIEAVFWVPFFFFFLLAAGQLAFVFYGQSAAQDLAQQATRAYSVGELTTEAEVASYVKNRLNFATEEVEVSSTVTDGMITTVVGVPAGEFGGPLRVFTALVNMKIYVTAQQVKEL